MSVGVNGEPCSCAGRWLVYPGDGCVWAHAGDCPVGAETDAAERAALVAIVLDDARFMSPANRALLAAELAGALAQRQPGDPP
jgi:hypothetical protein